MNELMRINDFVEELKLIIPDESRRSSFIFEHDFPYVVKNGIFYVETRKLIQWLERLSFEKRMADEKESLVRTIPKFSLAVGKYTNSYRHHLGELSKDRFVSKIALDQIDDTCFAEGMTFYSLEDAIQGIKAAIEHGDIEFAIEVCDGLLFGLSKPDWGDLIVEPSQDCEELPY